MFDGLYKKSISNRPFKELNEVEDVVASLTLEAGKWQLGARQVRNFWRVLLRVDILDYDIVLPKEYVTEKEALDIAYGLASTFLKMKKEFN